MDTLNKSSTMTIVNLFILTTLKHFLNEHKVWYYSIG